MLLFVLLLLLLLQRYAICGLDTADDVFASSTVVGGVAACVVACFKATGIWRISTYAIAKLPVKSTSRELLLMLKEQGLHENRLLK